jgi:hypothetical protein
MAVISIVRTVLPDWFNVDMIVVGWPGSQSWRGPMAFLGGVAGNILAIMYAIGSLAVVFLVAKLTRSKTAGIILGAIFSVGPFIAGENLVVEILIAIVFAVLWLVCLMRFGLLPLCVAQFVANILIDGLPTFDFSRWYAWRGLTEIVFVAAIALFAFKICLGKKPVFGATFDD